MKIQDIITHKKDELKKAGFNEKEKRLDRSIKRHKKEMKRINFSKRKERRKYRKNTRII